MKKKRRTLEMVTKIHDEYRSHELISYLKLLNFDQSIKRFMENRRNSETSTQHSVPHTQTHLVATEFSLSQIKRKKFNPWPK